MNSLKNHILISMPHLLDPYFKQSIVFLCEHTKEGAMGLIVNKPFENPDLKDLFTAVLDDKNNILEIVPKVFFGGPVMVERGIVLHSGKYTTEGSINISHDFQMTSSKKILHDISLKKGPELYRFVLGHAGWGKGQLEQEIGNGDWLLQETSPDFIFNTKESSMWKAAARSFGFDTDTFSGVGGQA
ncbi:MAG: YqgE/AlgH family protein [Candidatus Neomarinimicrobiota bacterium]